MNGCKLLSGFGSVSLDSNHELSPNGQIKATFTIVSTHPQAVDLVTKAAHSVHGVVSSTKYNGVSKRVTLYLAVTNPESFGDVHPWVRNFFEALDGITKTRRSNIRPNGLRVH